MAYPRVLATLVYAIDGDRVLLHRRVKAPNAGLWVAPGGKLERGESPAECAVRELHEESGLVAASVSLRGIMTEVSPRPDYQWLTFIFMTTTFSGTLTPAAEIGDFEWVRILDVFTREIPATDRIFFARVVRSSDPPFLVKFTYDEELRIVRMDEA